MTVSCNKVTQLYLADILCDEIHSDTQSYSISLFVLTAEFISRNLA